MVFLLKLTEIARTPEHGRRRLAKSAKKSELFLLKRT
jgi:hypothetical protein